MDIHPNPGPASAHILKDFTNPEQRVLFDKAKRLQLKLTRYEHRQSNYIYYYNHKIIPEGLIIKCRPTFESSSCEQLQRRWTKLLTRTSREMIKLLQIQCKKHLTLLTSEFNSILYQLKSTCFDSTFVHIKHFLQTSAAELSHALLSRKRKKQSSTGEYAARAFARTRQNNRPNRPQPTVTHSQSPIDASTNHIQPINAPIITTANSSTPIRNHRRRRKRKTTTNRYWRRDNHNIQLDSNVVINLSNVTTLTQDETQLLARGLSFCPTLRQID